MANIQTDITALRSMLDRTPSTHNIMLVGNHGIGKSEFLTGYFQEKGLKVVALFLGQMADPGDLIGLPTWMKTPAGQTSCRRTGSLRTESR